MKAYNSKHPSNIIVYEFEHITMAGGMWMVEVSFSQANWFHASKV
jgi:hypothetical protein